MKIIKTESIPLCHFDVSYERIVRLPADLRRILNFKVRATMYALIYDEFDPSKREKKVNSVHKSRETAKNALKKKAAQAW